MAIKAVNIRALKDKLSAYLRDVQHGDIVLVSDRGRVVAELRQPTLGQHAVDSKESREQRLVDAGLLRKGLPNDDPSVYRETGIRLPDRVIDETLDWLREDR